MNHCATKLCRLGDIRRAVKSIDILKFGRRYVNKMYKNNKLDIVSLTPI